MAVRGAPAIAIAAALALAAELINGGGGSQFADARDAERRITERLQYLVTRHEPSIISIKNSIDSYQIRPTRRFERASLWRALNALRLQPTHGSQPVERSRRAHRAGAPGGVGTGSYRCAGDCAGR